MAKKKSKMRMFLQKHGVFVILAIFVVVVAAYVIGIKIINFEETFLAPITGGRVRVPSELILGEFSRPEPDAIRFDDLTKIDVVYFYSDLSKGDLINFYSDKFSKNGWQLLAKKEITSDLYLIAGINSNDHIKAEVKLTPVEISKDITKILIFVSARKI